MKQTWQKTKEEVMSSLSVTESGLSQSEAEKRRAAYGPNAIEEGKKKSVAEIFVDQFKDFLVIVLICAAIISTFLGDVESMVVILAVITMNAMLGTIQSVKAESSLESLKKMAAPMAKVVRDGQTVTICASDVTIGDVLILEAGDMVSADARIIECASLKCTESALTGESLPVEKKVDAIGENVGLADRCNMVFSGCFVTYGRARAIVTQIGGDTEMGKIATLIKNTQEKKTPLQESLDDFGRKLTMIILVLCALIFAVSVFVQGKNVAQTFLFAVALAVAAIPEALSSIVTIVLSFGTRKMAKENAIIRKLQAVEGLGSVSVICSDKTGTLTQNKMSVKKIYAGGKVCEECDADFENPVTEPILRSALLCSDAEVTDKGEVGDPTETALIRLGQKHGADFESVRAKYPRVAELPFDSDRKMMSTVHNNSGNLLMLTKGAVDVLLARCIIEEDERKEIEKVNEMFSSEGLRVLAFACKGVEKEVIGSDDENNLNFLGLVAMMDPPREESKKAVEECIQMGITPVMITGDHKITASAIAKEIGILTDGKIALEGSEIESLTDDKLEKIVPQVGVYARVTPEHKLRIVKAWQRKGNIVSMTGDGVNDAPALKQADIGVAMGITGTQVSKDAAGVILADDNFATIVEAVKNGRNLYANIKKAIGFLLSGNLAGILTVLYASILNLPVPFAAVHLLFINLLTDSLPAIALGLEPHSESVRYDKPRNKDEGILTKEFVINIACEGMVIALATIAAFRIGLLKSPETGSTMAFATLCMSRLFHSFTSKSDKAVIFRKKMFDNKALTGAFVLGGVLLACVIFVPAFRGVFNVANLSEKLVGTIGVLSFGSMAINQVLRWLKSII